MIDVLIPVLARPQNAAKVAESLKVTREPYRLVFICSPNDHEQIKASRAQAETWVVPWKPGAGDYARKINWAARQTDSEWIFTGADDIIFHADWDEAALRDGHRVIGTNDLHNPSVKAGTHATHFLIARSWLEERGEIFHEGYDHWYVDNELVNVARKQGEWGFAADSHVEHLHPHWGLAEPDDTYRKGTRRARQDAALYRSRRR